MSHNQKVNGDKGRSCIALLSGGLDSMLAIRLMQQQGIHVEAVNFQTVFTCCQDTAGQTARDLGVRLTVVAAEDDYLQLIRKPKFGFGKGANPCVDCRIYMFERAARLMEELSADFIVSGEVIGQRPKSQKRKDLEVISYHSGLEDILLRPLSAKMLPPTLPEREGWVDRDQLFDFTGRNRKPLIALAKELGISEIPSPSTGCALTETKFSHKVRDLVKLDADSQRWDFELLRIGHHYRIGRHHKVIVGRNADENGNLVYMSQREDAQRCRLIEPADFIGPAVLLIGPADETSGDSIVDSAAAVMLRHVRETKPEYAVSVTYQGDVTTRIVQPDPEAFAHRITTGPVSKATRSEWWAAEKDRAQSQA